MRIVEAPSPNHGPRPPGGGIDILLLHYTGMVSAAAALERMRDPEAQVSAHYMIDEDGTVTRLVAEERRAWHAGVSEWAGATDINGRSIGIELVNPGHEFGYRPFPVSQMEALIELSLGIVGRWPIPPHRILGHSDVAPARKQDPGELFDWRQFAARGLGLWPAAAEPALPPISLDEAAGLLTQFGYRCADDAGHRVRLSAFQRHFRPGRVDGVADAETVGLLRAVCEMLP